MKYLPIIIISIIGLSLISFLQIAESATRDCKINTFHIIYQDRMLKCLNEKITTENNIMKQEFELKEKILNEKITELEQRVLSNEIKINQLEKG